MARVTLTVDPVAWPSTGAPLAGEVIRVEALDDQTRTPPAWVEVGAGAPDAEVVTVDVPWLDYGERVRLRAVVDLGGALSDPSDEFEFLLPFPKPPRPVIRSVVAA